MRSPDESVLDLLERGEHGLAVGRDLGVVGLARRLDLRARQPAVEQRLGERGAERPDRIGGAVQRGERIAGIAEQAGQRHGRKIAGEGDADLGVGLAHRLLGRRDVGPALEQRRTAG